MAATSKTQLVLGFPLEDASHGAQFFCSVLTVAFFASGILLCTRIRKEKSVKDVNYLPFLMTCLNCALWTSYGYVITDLVVVGVNLCGFILQLVYLFTYLKYLGDPIAKAIVVKRIIAAVIFYLTVSLVVYMSPASVSQKLFGLTCDIVTIMMFASPLSSMGEVLRTRNTASMSFLQSFMMFLVSVSWLFYGYLEDDIYIKVPNGLGALLGLLQLVLFLIFPTHQQPTRRAFPSI